MSSLSPNYTTKVLYSTGRWKFLLAQRAMFPPLLVPLGFAGGSVGKESVCNVGDIGSILRLRRSPWRRKWQLAPIFLPGKSPWAEEPGGVWSMGLQNGCTRLSD